MEPDSDDLLRTSTGRLRLGWRLLVFLSVGWVLSWIAALVVPHTFQGGAAAMLAVSCGAGAAALAFDGRGPGALGFYMARSVPKEALAGLGLGVLVAVLVSGGMAGTGGLRFGSDPGSAAQWLIGGVAALGLFAIPAAAEEALLRGYPLQALGEAWGPGIALLVTSALFGAIHLENPGVTPLGVVNVGAAGLFLGALYLRTGSLWWATGAHLGWNWGLGYLADVPVSGLDLVDAPLVAASPGGPAWLGGGGFGPEGSVVATVAFLVATAACWWGRWLKPEPAALVRRPLVLRLVGGSPPPTPSLSSSPRP